MLMILNENVKAVSNGALQQLDLDLVQCEQFAASEPIQGLEVILFWVWPLPDPIEWNV